MDFYIFTTNKCNLNCRYCRSFFKKNKEEYPDVDQTAKFIIENLHHQKNNVTFYGGEPLLRQEWIKRFIGLTKGNNLFFTLQTNGTLLDGIDDFILDNLDFIHLSIDGDQEMTDRSRGRDVYKKIVANLREIKSKFKGKTLARMVLTPDGSIYDVVNHLISLKLFDYIYWQLEISLLERSDINYNQIKEHYQEGINKLVDLFILELEQSRILGIIPFFKIIISIIKKEIHNNYRCGAGTFLVSITSDGNCYSCDELLDLEYQIGNIRNGIKQKPLYGCHHLKFCGSCDIKSICGGRCFQASVFPVEKFRFYCDMTKILVKAIQDKIPQVEKLIIEGKISLRDFDSNCFTEEIP